MQNGAASESARAGYPAREAKAHANGIPTCVRSRPSDSALVAPIAAMASQALTDVGLVTRSLAQSWQCMASRLRALEMQLLLSNLLSCLTLQPPCALLGAVYIYSRGN